MKYCYVIMILFLLGSQYAISQSLPPARAINWANAGFSKNIPLYTPVRNILTYGGDPEGNTSNDQALEQAISSLDGQNGIIYFPTGNFLFNAPVHLRSGLVLKGNGTANTSLIFQLGGSGDLISINGSLSATEQVVTSPIIKGQSWCIVNRAASFSAGDYCKLYDNDTALAADNWARGATGQLLLVDSVKGDTVYFRNPLRRNYTLPLQPRLVKVQVVQGTGIECVKIRRLDATPSQSSNILFRYAANCWVKGVESERCNFSHVQLSGAANILISNNYFHDAFSYGEGGEGYGISCEYGSGDCLVENNIFRHLRHSMLVQSGANGNVFAYNYSIEPFKTDNAPFDFSGDIVLHGNYPYLNLFEGNIVQNIIADASHGKNGPFNTFFRNRVELYGIIITPGAGDSSNVMANEITGTGFQKGNYLLFGNGHFEYANNKNDTLLPATVSIAPARSLLYDKAPAFWNIPFVWPALGFGFPIRSGNIPAKQRSGSVPVFCLEPLAVQYTFTGNGNWSDTGNWLNGRVPPSPLSQGSAVIIDPVLTGKCILNVPVTINPGASLQVRPGKKIELTAPLFLVK